MPVIFNLAQDGNDLLASCPDHLTAKEETHIPIAQEAE